MFTKPSSKEGEYFLLETSLLLHRLQRLVQHHRALREAEPPPIHEQPGKGMHAQKGAVMRSIVNLIVPESDKLH